MGDGRGVRYGPVIDAVPRPVPAFLEEERRQLGDWWSRQEYLCGFAATTDQVFACDLVMGALSSDVAPLFPVSGGLPITIADSERRFSVAVSPSLFQTDEPRPSTMTPRTSSTPRVPGGTPAGWPGESATGSSTGTEPRPARPGTFIEHCSEH